MNKFKTVFKYELLKHLRRKRFYGALAAVLLATFLMTFLYRSIDIPGKMRESLLERLPENIPRETGEMILDQYGIKDSPEFFAVFTGSVGPSIALLFSVFFAGDAIASEFERKTGVFLFSSPVGRKTIVAGKYFACLIATISLLAVGYAVSALSILGLYGTVPFGMLGSLGVAFAVATFMVAMTFIFSSLMRGGMGATVATLLTYMIIFSIISTSLVYAGYDPWFMPDRAADAISATYNVSLESVYGAFGISAQIKTPEPLTSSILLLSYSVFLLLASIILTERREFA
ncbi:MAG: ABC transporter permease subunit [Candidatus Hadarchaeales archaeon]